MTAPISTKERRLTEDERIVLVRLADGNSLRVYLNGSSMWRPFNADDTRPTLDILHPMIIRQYISVSTKRERYFVYRITPAGRRALSESGPG